VIVLIGGWSTVTWQYPGLRRSTLKCVEDRDQTSESRTFLDGLSQSYSCRTPKSYSRVCRQ